MKTNAALKRAPLPTSPVEHIVGRQIACAEPLASRAVVRLDEQSIAVAAMLALEVISKNVRERTRKVEIEE